MGNDVTCPECDSNSWHLYTRALLIQAPILNDDLNVIGVDNYATEIIEENNTPLWLECCECGFKLLKDETQYERPIPVAFGKPVEGWHVQCSLDGEQWYWEEFGVGYQLGKTDRRHRWKHLGTGATHSLEVGPDGNVLPPRVSEAEGM